MANVNEYCAKPVAAILRDSSLLNLCRFYMSALSVHKYSQKHFDDDHSPHKYKCMKGKSSYKSWLYSSLDSGLAGATAVIASYI